MQKKTKSHSLLNKYYPLFGVLTVSNSPNARSIWLLWGLGQCPSSHLLASPVNWLSKNRINCFISLNRVRYTVYVPLLPHKFFAVLTAITTPRPTPNCIQNSSEKRQKITKIWYFLLFLHQNLHFFDLKYHFLIPIYPLFTLIYHGF